MIGSQMFTPQKRDSSLLNKFLSAVNHENSARNSDVEEDLEATAVVINEKRANKRQKLMMQMTEKFCEKFGRQNQQTIQNYIEKRLKPFN